jgi:hypothetical protein
MYYVPIKGGERVTKLGTQCQPDTCFGVVYNERETTIQVVLDACPSGSKDTTQTNGSDWAQYLLYNHRPDKGSSTQKRVVGCVDIINEL